MTLYQSKLFTPRGEDKNIFTPREQDKNVFTPRDPFYGEHQQIHFDMPSESFVKKKKSSPIGKKGDHNKLSMIRNSQTIDQSSSWYGGIYKPQTSSNVVS
jgi:hypothetical protein